MSGRDYEASHTTISTLSVVKNGLELQAAKVCPLARKEQNSLPFNYRSQVIMEDTILVISILKTALGTSYLHTFLACFLVTEILVITQIQQDYKRSLPTCVRSGISPLSIPTCCGYKKR